MLLYITYFAMNLVFFVCRLCTSCSQQQLVMHKPLLQSMVLLLQLCHCYNGVTVAISCAFHWERNTNIEMFPTPPLGKGRQWNDQQGSQKHMWHSEGAMKDCVHLKLPTPECSPEAKYSLPTHQFPLPKSEDEHGRVGSPPPTCVGQYTKSREIAHISQVEQRLFQHKSLSETWWPLLPCSDGLLSAPGLIFGIFILLSSFSHALHKPRLEFRGCNLY